MAEQQRRVWRAARSTLTLVALVRIGVVAGEPVRYLALNSDAVLHLGVLPRHTGNGYGSRLIRMALPNPDPPRRRRS